MQFGMPKAPFDLDCSPHGVLTNSQKDFGQVAEKVFAPIATKSGGRQG
jgi:hypothetical protein